MHIAFQSVLLSLIWLILLNSTNKYCFFFFHFLERWGPGKGVDVTLPCCIRRCGADLYQIVSVYQHFIYETPSCSTLMKCNYAAARTSLVYHMKNVSTPAPQWLMLNVRSALFPPSPGLKDIVFARGVT